MSYEQQILDILMQNPERSKADFLHIDELIKEKDLSYKNILVRTLAVPKILSAEAYEIICAFIAQVYRIFDRVIDQYFADPSYRALFGFAPELEELILASPRRSCWVPMARIDFFLNEETNEIKMCEINTDGTSGMSEDLLLGDFLFYNNAFLEFMQGKTYQRFEYFDSWAEEFLAYYGGEAPPRTAIVDFLDVGYVTEFERFKETFIRHGMETEICDIRALTYEDGKLKTPNGMAIDAIYRRAVTADIMKHYNEVQPFIEAARDGAVCLVGSFATQIVHNKRLFYILYHPQTRAILGREEKAFVTKHFPATFPLNKETIAAHKVYQEREKWIIKPCDSYGALGVYAGKSCNEADWQKRCEEHLADDYVLQAFNMPYKTPHIDFREAEPKIRDYSNLIGVFCYNGKPYGAYTRIAGGDIISTQYDEKTIATVLV
ncbi:MAG: hypothetical protein LBI54_02400 [Lachnospiraceae bacterium]|jgi:uncharacterized circularly permuted ATP-grasp superfamily protein|nr:hypothetical protein [Lachnospiraceae bacterium]